MIERGFQIFEQIVDIHGRAVVQIVCFGDDIQVAVRAAGKCAHLPCDADRPVRGAGDRVGGPQFVRHLFLYRFLRVIIFKIPRQLLRPGADVGVRARLADNGVLNLNAQFVGLLADHFVTHVRSGCKLGEKQAQKTGQKQTKRICHDGSLPSNDRSGLGAKTAITVTRLCLLVQYLIAQIRGRPTGSVCPVRIPSCPRHPSQPVS